MSYNCSSPLATPNRLVDVDPLDRHADLTGVGKRAARCLLGGPAGVDAVVDDQRVVAAKLQDSVGAAGRARAGDLAAGLCRAGVEHDRDIRMRDELSAGLGIALHQRENPVGQMLGQQLRQQCRAGRGAF